jgi:hypothetical protein
MRSTYSKVQPRIERVTALEYDKGFADKVCLVTGATSGIGKCVARKLLRAGKLEVEEQAPS